MLEATTSLTKKEASSESPTSSEREYSRAHREDSLLRRISPLFEVKKTVYGGRGCFASQKIEKNSSLLKVNFPVGSSVVRPFRKEVCTWCFHYDDGRSMKYKLKEKVYFCSELCRSNFEKTDPEGTLAATMAAAEDLYVKCAGEISESDVPNNEEELLSEFVGKWKSVEEWESRVFRMKPSKRQQHYPTVTPEDYAEIRYVLSSLHNICQSRDSEAVSHPRAEDNVLFYEQLSEKDAMKFEIEALEILQSSEMDKVRRYPYLLVSYTSIYKFVRLVSPEKWFPFVTPQNIRDLIGRNLTNAFGIWSPVTQENEEREFFGFGVYPSASFFNHSCAYNVKKIRSGASYEFIASREISPGEELCISYGINGDETVVQRRESLREWFFVCGCTKCMAESADK